MRRIESHFFPGIDSYILQKDVPGSEDLILLKVVRGDSSTEIAMSKNEARALIRGLNELIHN